MTRGIKSKWVVLIAVIMLALIISIIAFPTVVQAAKSNFKQFYKSVNCYGELCAYGKCIMVCYKK